MTLLSVNINKVAVIRNSRGGNVPNVVQVALDCEKFGADGITVHPRPDERHIRRSDVFELKTVLTKEFNIEGYPSVDFIKMVTSVKPAQVTLVPDPPDALTSNAGWDTIKNFSFLEEVISEFKLHGIRTSVFIEPNLKFIELASKLKTDRIELYTEPYAKNYLIDREEAVREFVVAARFASEIGLQINAGHDLNLDNLKFFSDSIPELSEVSIGHALISDSLYFGIENTIQMYQRQLNKKA
ncbi:MAG: pyridoxine 5'-phosphate synthase [Bacteroidales bacterium]|nr:pyridoxine 5'-phosphate synthase [Bacteroidales bacterium]